MKIKEITNYLEEIAPLAYQEEYDNSGLIIGSEDMDVKNSLITLDCTEKVVDEAISKDCNLIICHHPVVFSGIKRFNGNNYTERIVMKAIKNNIAIYAIHTNLDNIHNGVNAKIAEKIGLTNCKVLFPKVNLLRQLVVYCPNENAKALKKALFNSGAGSIGNYDNCSFSSLGKGTFKPGEDASPAVGKIGELHIADEERIEVVYSKEKEKKILQTMFQHHPYEEVAYQIYLIQNQHQLIGSGLVGELKNPVNCMNFLKLLKKNMKLKSIRYTELLRKKIKTVAVCGGSGGFLLNHAKATKADVFITADVKYHQFFDAEDKITIIDIGHYESEQFTKDLIYDFLTKKFTKFAFQLSKINTNPVNYG